ncbi:MAG: glycerol-3-phosphate acyltransferase, partial [Actinobacteria bacterium]
MTLPTVEMPVPGPLTAAADAASAAVATLPWWAAALGSLVVAYLLGGIPWGVVVARFYKFDLTKAGSGNTGATNVFRTLGWRPALITVLADIAKGAVPAALALWLTHGWTAQWHRDLLVICVGVAAMAGHMYSPYFKLRGGKGIATGAGAIVVLMPKVFLLLLVIFVVVVATSRIVSLGSLIVALAFPLAIWLLYGQDRPALLAFAALGVPLVFWA